MIPVRPSDDELALWHILTDPSAVSTVEFLWQDPERPDGCFRCHSYQHAWWSSRESLSIDQCSRDVGKSISIAAGCFNFCFRRPGQQKALVAPELNHLNLLIGAIEYRLQASWVTRQMMKPGNKAFTHKPFECVGEGQMVWTARGFVPIENVVVGDLVLTHLGRWRPVTHVWDRGVRPVVKMKGMGHEGLIVTPEHQLWGARVKQRETWKSGRRAMERVQQSPGWISACNWRTREPADRWASPADWIVPNVPESECPPNIKLNKQGYGVGNGALIDVTDENFLWLAGLYVAEGSVTGLNLVIWSLHQDETDYVMGRLEEAGFHAFRRSRDIESDGDCLAVTNQVLASWMRQYLPGDCYTKQVPLWVFHLEEKQRRAFLDGYLYGDGHLTKLGHQSPGTASRGLAYSLRLLALSLGFQCGIYPVPPKRHCYINPSGSLHWINSGKNWAIHINTMDPETLAHVHTKYTDDGHAWTAVNSVVDAGQAHVYDLSVAEDHSFVVEGIVVHNCVFLNGTQLEGRIPQRDGRGVKGLHALELDVDEGQDLPEPAYRELVETVKRSLVGFRFRIHGVTRGVHDSFYRLSQPGSGFYVHRIVAMHRPTWSQEERTQKIEEYGGVESPDYKRNILGEHGDEQSSIFTLSSLLGATDSDELSQYNAVEYRRINITGEDVAPEENAILSKLDFPALHLAQGRYERFWMGMDVGMTIHPSEILVFGEYKGRTRDEDSTLKLLLRVHMLRVKAPHQAEAIRWLIAQYRPTVFAMDSTGVGLPIVQQLQVWQEREAVDPGLAEVRQQTERALSVIKGYNFSAKVPVGLQEAHTDPDGVEHEEELITRNVQNAATDMLRTLVDDRRLLLPWDRDLISQFQGQTWTSTKSSLDPYGKRSYSLGTFHCLTGDSLVMTERGEIPIVDVVVNDQVMTRQGWKPVIDSWMTNPSAEVLTLILEDGKKLSGTAEHLVWTNVGWLPLGKITTQHEVGICERTTSFQNALPGGGPSGSATQSQNDARTGSITWRSMVPAVVYTGPSGRRPMGRSLQTASFITQTGTHLTTISAISNALTDANTSPTTVKRGRNTSRPMKIGSSTLSPSGTMQPSGTLLTKDERGTPSTPNLLSLPANSWSSRASIVATPSSPNTPTPSIATRRASNVPMPQIQGTRSTGSAVSATVPTAVSATPKARPVLRRVRAVQHQRRVEPVYDLTVADAHEFYANGILVHNCLDAARMAAIAYSNYKLEEMLRLRTKAEKPAEIFLSFLE